MFIKSGNTPLLIFSIFTALYIIVTFVWIVKTEKRLGRFFLGKKAKDLEDTIEIMQKEMMSLKDYREKNSKDVADLYSKTKKSIRGLETIRFNPFPDQGSNQSFAIGLLNEENDGVVISSLYSRERMSVFAKPIKKGKSDYELTEEEKEVLKKAEV